MKKINAKLIGIAGLLLGVAGISFLSSNNEKYSSFGSIILLISSVFLIWWHVQFWMSYARSKGYYGIPILFLIIFGPVATILLLLPRRGSDKKTSEQRARERMNNMGLNKNEHWQEYYKIRVEEEEKIKREILDKKIN